MQLTISPEAKSAYPGLKVGVVEVSLGSDVEFNPELTKLKAGIESAIRKDYSEPEKLERVVKYNKFYKKFDSKVPMEFQIRSVLNGKEVPAFNPVLTCMFLAELKNVVLTAGHDASKLGDSIEVSVSNGSEEYVKINGKPQKLKPLDVFAKDGGEIISSVLYGPDLRTKITDESRKLLFMCYSFDLISEELEGHMKDITSYLKLLDKGAKIGAPKIV